MTESTEINPRPVRAKMFVSTVTPTVEEAPDAPSRQVVLGAVCRGIENAVWASATPAATLTMTIRNDTATAQFIKGEEYDVLFTHSPKPMPGDGHEIAPVVGNYGWLVCERCGASLGPATEDAARSYDGKVGVLDEQRRVHDEVYGAKDPEPES